MSTSINLFRFSKEFLTYSPGETILRKGEPGDKMFVVQEGEVDMILDGTVIETVGPGGIFGEMALIDGRPRSSDAVAKTECKIVPIDEKRFTFLVGETPMFALQVMRILVSRVRSSMQRMNLDNQ